MRYQYIIVIVIGLSIGFIYNSWVVSAYGNSGPTIDDKLRNLDAALDHMVNVCWKETNKGMCLDQLEDSWWIDCSEWGDKLDTCKNGKIKDFLSNHGRPT